MEISHTNWNLYRNFVLLCETQNMHKAAELCGITRSGISHNITELERQLGKNLFITSTKGVEPTSEAMSLYPSIKSAISIITDAENGLEVFNEISEAIIKIGVAPSILNAKLSKYIAQFTRQYKNVSFVFFDRNSLDLLNQKKLDFHIRSEFVVKGHEYKTIDLFTDELVFIASQNFVKEHKLKTKLSFDEIKNEKIIASQYI
ncbi:MAG: LysR family transcriptional regulator, partial [Christensenellaceae bacterium]|nr:LysR family transcriptional regulator [Christensenellaceae bacterium]